ncbi:hypothetical protein BH09PSE6_BH09PSE6_13010 [soil metagenome]
MKCPNCSQAIADDATSCLWCGSPVGMVPGQPVPVYGRTQATSAAAVASAPAGASTGAAPPAAGGTAPPAPGSGTASSGFIARVTGITLRPKLEWPVIDAETTPTNTVLFGYVAPLAVLLGVMTFIHLSVIGISMPFYGLMRTPVFAGLFSSIVSLVMTFIGVLIIAALIEVFAPTFGGQKNMRQSIRTAAYAFTPAWIASVAMIVPWLGTLVRLVAACYAVYVLYLGLPVMMRVAKEKAAGYTAAVVACAIVVGIVLGIVTSSIIGIAMMATGSLPGVQESRRQADREQGAAIVGNVLGGILGSDSEGKKDLSDAMARLAKAGEDAQRASAAAAPGVAAVPGTPDATAKANADSAAATASVLSALGGIAAGGKKVEPIDFRTLKALLPPTLPGLDTIHSEGSTNEAVGMKSAMARAQYGNAANQRIDVKIEDMSSISGLLGLANAVGSKTESESATGFEKNVKIGGHRVHEKYTFASQYGELEAIVGKRFVVTVTGNGLPVADLEKAMSAVDLDKLASMKDQGAQ